MIELYEWQKDAYNKFRISDKGGIISACTGSGKTILGLKIIEDNPNSKILITVPTIVLQRQWKGELVKKFKIISEKDISLIGGGHTDIPGNRVTIAVINSLRNVDWNHPKAAFDYVICDEVHRYASAQNIRFLQRGKFGKIIGLTATLQREDNNHQLLKQYIGPVIYTLTNTQAKELGYVSQYEVVLVKCKFTREEMENYSYIDTKVRKYMKIFNGNYNAARNIMKQGFRHVMFNQAVTLMKAVQERKKVLTDVQSKRDIAVKLVQDNTDKRIILFDEIQASANQIHRSLINLGIRSAIYHSGIKKKVDKENAIKDFKSGVTNVLLGCRSLDEGLDVKDADFGIIVNGNSQKRQVLQRLGRVLRKKEGKIAKLILLYVPNTKDEEYVMKRIKYLDASNNFTIKTYQEVML